MSDIEFKSALQVALRNAPVDIHVSKLNAVILADAALAVVQKRAEQLARELVELASPRAEAYHDAARKVRRAFGLATREESNQ